MDVRGEPRVGPPHGLRDHLLRGCASTSEPANRAALVCADPRVSKTPTTGDSPRQVRANSGTEFEQEFMNGARRMTDERMIASSVSKTRSASSGAKYRSQDSKRGFDIPSCRIRRTSRSRIHASSTGSPSIAMELAT